MAESKSKKEELVISPPNLQTVVFRIVGVAPYVQCKFSKKARQEIKDTEEAGHTGKKGKKREAKNFQRCYEEATYRADDGWCGIPASSFRNGMVSACRLVGYAMTRAKLAIFIEPDGFDAEDKIPLVRILKGEPKYFETYVRLPNGNPDIRPRPLWESGWEADVRITFDADQMTLRDIANLLARVGLQVGIGEGRPDSKKSCGMGYGLFTIANKEEGQ